MKINEIKYINSTESIDFIISSIVNGLIEFKDSNALKLEIKLKIRKLKLQIYFEDEFNKHLDLITLKKTSYKEKENTDVNSINIKKIGIKSNANKKIKNKMLMAKGKPEYAKKKNPLSEPIIDFDFDSIKNKSINEVAIELKQPQKRLLSLISKKNNKYIDANENTLIDEEIWASIEDYLKNAYKLKVRREKAEKSINTNPTKKAQKFKASTGRPGNYAKLILIRTKT